MVVFAPIIWPFMGIFCLVSLANPERYWNYSSGIDGPKDDGLINIFGAIPYNYWFMFAKAFFVDYFFSTYDPSGETKAYNTKIMPLIFGWWLLYPLNYLNAAIYFWWGIVAWATITIFELSLIVS